MAQDSLDLLLLLLPFLEGVERSLANLLIEGFDADLGHFGVQFSCSVSIGRPEAILVALYLDCVQWLSGRESVPWRQLWSRLVRFGFEGGEDGVHAQVFVQIGVP